MAVMIRCSSCNKGVEIPVTDEQIKKWKEGELIQRAMPNISADQRELFISGICGTCFDKMFRNEEQ